MTSQDAQRLAALVRAQFGMPDLIPQLTRLLITTGQPVTIEQAAQAGGWTAEQVRGELARHPGVDWADDGRIVGFGMTLRPTPHRFTTNGGYSLAIEQAHRTAETSAPRSSTNTSATPHRPRRPDPARPDLQRSATALTSPGARNPI